MVCASVCVWEVSVEDLSLKKKFDMNW